MERHQRLTPLEYVIYAAVVAQALRLSGRPLGRDPYLADLQAPSLDVGVVYTAGAVALTRRFWGYPLSVRRLVLIGLGILLAIAGLSNLTRYFGWY